ncbi:MAG: AAA family ATPase [Caldilineaceae bacterium]|nr:AAA family ATPase [Caldilineaceae bacterium]
MTERRYLVQPKDERGNDANDWRDDPNYLERLTLSDSQPDPVSIWDAPLDVGGLIRRQPQPMRWLVSNRIQLGRGGLVAGIGGSSKTRFLYHVAIGAAVESLPWDWEIATPGKSVLVLTEDTAEDAHRTLYEMARGLGLTDAQIQRVADSVTIYPLAGKDMKLLARDERGALVKTPHFHELQSTIASLGGVVWVGIDPALSVTEGDELDQNDQRTLGKMADDLAVTTGAACFIAAHSTKGSQQTEELTSHNSRGGGAITDAVRMEYAMRTMTAAEALRASISDIEERKRHVQLVATKGNHLPPAAFSPVWLRRGEFGVLSAADLDFTGGADPVAKDMDALAILREMAQTTSPKLADWRTQCIAAGLIPDGEFKRQEKAMQRIIKRLSAAGLVERGFTKGVYQPATEQ